MKLDVCAGAGVCLSGESVQVCKCACVFVHVLVAVWCKSVVVEWEKGLYVRER